MFESLVANLLNRFLGSFIENFDPKQLNIGIWSGDVKLKNLRLKKESLDKFKLPVDVKFGHLGELTLQIPWSNLKSKPVKVIIEDVYILASPIILQDIDIEEEERRELLVKKEKLENLKALEAAAAQNLDLAEDSSANESFTQSLVTKIIDNLQVTIKNIHVRYEDDSVLTENPYSVGITLNELSATSTDESWIPSFISITQAFTHKLVTLKSLSCYMNTDSRTIFTEDSDELLRIFKESITNEEFIHDIQYILKPISGEGRLTISKKGATEKSPHVKAELFFDEFGIDLDSQQYKDILWTASKFHWYIKTQKFRKFRPKVSVEEDPKAWFRYAAKSILDEIHKKNYKWSWEYFSTRRDQRKTYVQLWKSKLLNKPLSPEEEKKLDDLEIELPFEDIKFYRSLTRNEIRKEKKLLTANSSASESSNQSSGGWISYLWGGSSALEEASEVNDDNIDLQLNNDQRKALYEAIEYDENQVLTEAIDMPRDRVKFEILTTLKKGGISIRQRKHEPNLAEVIFEGFSTQIYQRPDSLLANFQLQEFRVEDGTKTTLYKHIVSVKQSHSHLHHDEVDSIPSPGLASNEPFFKISFEHKPLDESADSILLGKLKSMTIFYNPHFIQEIIKFFTPPKVHLSTVGAIMNAAEATMEGITSQTRIGLQYALEEHKTINVKLDLQAPLIILPLDPSSWKSPVAILDAGHISVISNLVEKSKIEEIKSKESYTSEDWNQLKDLMYDKFNLHLQDAQFLVGPTIKSTMEQLHMENGDKSALILDKLDLKLLLGISILPEAYNLAKIKIGGEVTKIDVAMNDFQYKTIMKIIDKAIPDFENIDTDDSSIFDAYGNHKENELVDIDDSDESSTASNKNVKDQKADAMIKQHLFEFDFNVDLVQISLSRCIDGASLRAEPLIDLVGDSLRLNFFKTINDMHLDLVVANINVIDHIEKSGVPEFQTLVSSNKFAENDKKDKELNKDLFRLEYKRSQRVVDFNGKEIEVFDQDIVVDIATVKFVISRKTLLSLLNFILNTFTDPNELTEADQIKHNDSNDANVSPQKINVDVNLESIIMVLNEDGVKLATLQLSKADINVFLLPEEMEVRGKLGALSLHDEVNQGSPRDSILRNLINIEGNNLAEFTYKTFDIETNSNPYNSLIEFKTGSATINFVEDAFCKIFNYLSQFQKMKAIYDSAREAAIDQANQIEGANKIKFDFLVKAPVIVFPKLIDNPENTYDKMTAHLGELYASNEFVMGDNITQNIITAGIRNISVESQFHFDKGIQQKSELVNDLDISFKIDYCENYTESKPTFVVDGKMPEIDMHLTELQLQYLMRLSESVTKVFDISDTDEFLDDIEEDAANANAVAKYDNLANREEKIDKETSETEKECIPHDHQKVALRFDVPRVSLTLYNRTSGIKSYDSNKISSFTLNGFALSLDMNKDSYFKSDVNVQSFVVEDVREGSSNKFTEIIPLVSHDNNQFVLKASTNGPVENKNVTIMLTVDNPKTILALDYIFELQSFVNKGLEREPEINQISDESDEELENQTRSTSSRGNIKSKNGDTEEAVATHSIGFSVNITEPSVILLADSTNESTEAIVFKVEQILITSQNIMSIAANKIGMFLCTMDAFDEKRLRIIDDFSVSFAHDSRGSTKNNFLTNIEASIEPLLMRLSLRDIRLALNIFNRAKELYSMAQGNLYNAGDEGDYYFSEEFKRRLSQYAPSILSNFSNKSEGKNKDNTSSQVIIKGEELNATIGGLRFVLIGDIHELPVLDMNVKPFDVKAINWSTDLSAETHAESFINIYNYARSTWEPLIEPWPISVYASKTITPSPSIMIDVVSRQLAEVNISSRSIALLSQVFSLITTEQNLRSRGDDDPYRIVNETGYDIEAWADQNTGNLESKTIIKSGDVIPWSFEDWREIRENLDSDKKLGILGINLVGSPYDQISGISATGEGEDLFALYPPVNGVHNRLSCEMTLGEDNIKTIWLRSTVKIQNDADIPIAIRIIESDNGKERELIIESKKTHALPIDCVYSGSIRIKPSIDTTYNWSEEELRWRDHLKGGMPLCCTSMNENDRSSYYFHSEPKYDSDEPLCKIYPHMNLVISAPVEIENLLPFDFDYRLYDKSARKDWSGTIQKGVKNYVHVVSLQSLLLFSVEPKDCGFEKSEFAIINAISKSEFKRESAMTLRHKDGQILRIRIHYPKKKSDSTSLKVVIYSPYIILNRTSQNIVVSEKGNMMHSNSKSSFKPTIPCMFSFEKHGDRSNRALLKINDSSWTSPLSFDAIGQSTSAKTQVSGRQTEMNVGISVAEGEGKYNLSKVITIAPRYIFRNCLDEPLEIVENGSTKQTVIAPNELSPLYGLRRTDQKSLLMKFFHSSKTWSSPFALDDVGQIFLKVYKENVGQVLLKVNILLEDATMFIQVENANNNWPYSIRNFSDSEFYIYQHDPNINENGDIVKQDTEYKPVFYKIPAKSVMPYAFDYPNAVIKELIIRSHGRERAINLAEIGNLKPFRLPQTQGSDQTIVDLNVVADGPTQSLIISNYDPSMSLYKLKNKSQSTASLSQQKFETTETDENYHTKIITRFEGLGISLINTRAQELCYISLRGIELRYNESDLYQNLSVKLKWIQIDNQLFGGIFPIVLYPSVVPKSGKEMNNHPSFSGAICKVKDDSHGVLFIKYATILLQEMTVEIDEDFLFALLDFARFPGASWNKHLQDKLCDDNLELPEPLSLSNSSDIYFEALHLQPTLTNLSFVRTERVNAEDRTSSQNTLMFFFNVLTMAIGNINDAPIKLNALFIENIRIPIPILVESIQTHYGQAFFYQVHKILGSADFLGNPVGLFNNLSSGVLDIFYEPYQGFIINDRPQELGIGIAKGGLSFLKKSIFGFSDSFAKVTGSLAKGLSVVTLDKKFQERRRLNQRRNKPKHALYGFASGANSFIDSVSSGVTGIATAPIEGANKNGASGFFRGLGKGVVGLPTKTAIGFFDLASNVSEGIRNTTTVFDADGLDKVRLPRYISHDQIIRPYVQREAQGQFWLKSIDGGILFNERYIAHLLLPGEEKAIVVTFRKIILFEVNTLKSKWVIPLEQVKSISNEGTGISIGLKKKEGPFIPIPEKTNRTFFYNRISIAVGEFNKHCQVTL